MSASRFGEIGEFLNRFRSGDFKRLTRSYLNLASGYIDRLKRQAAPASNERTTTIDRLEQALADERDQTAALQRTVDNLKFQTEVLERGYTTQLEEARQRAEEAECSLAERDAELAELTVKHGAATESLASMQGELQRVTAQRDRLRRQIDGDPEPDDSEGADADSPEGTINRLLAAASRPRVPRRTEDEPSPGENEAGSGEMLAPELLLSKKEADGS